jgi:hypothetical protein
MFYTPTNSDTQANFSARLNKRRFNLASLPVINPVLISIASSASRLIDEMEDVFNQIINAPSNDGRQVLVARRSRMWGRNKKIWYKEARFELDAAFDTCIYTAYHDLMGDVMCWYQDATGIRLTMPKVLDSEFDIEAPIEIRQAVQFLNVASLKRALLTDMLELSKRQRHGLVSTN